jgi:hypothetical protein
MRALIFCVLLMGVCPLFAQTGPAGVGTPANNSLWLKANTGTSSVTNGVAVSSWADASGNSNNAIQATSTKQPIYNIGVMNGMPGLFFDNASGPNNDEMMVADNSNLDNTAGLTILTVSRPSSIDGNARALVSKRLDVGSNQSYTLFYYSSNHLYIDLDGNGQRFNNNVTYSGGRDYVNSLVFDGTLASTSRARVYVNEALDFTGSESSATIPDFASPLMIGTMNQNDGRPFGGYITEIIIYRKALNAAERIIVHNYLFAKYGFSSGSIPATVNDIYAGDDPGNGNYDFEVAGVGVDATGGSNISASSSVTGGLSITQVSGFENGDFLLFGHGAGLNDTQITDVGGMTGVNNGRWRRVWYADVTNTSTTETVDFSFDISDSGGGVVTPVTASNYVLLYRAGQTGNWTEVMTASSLTDDQINFAGVAVPADGYYTVGSRNYIASPLPVGLLSFAAELTEKGVELRWTTATENNNDHFTIERSPNGESFKPIAIVNGSGDSFEERTYTAFDHEPFSGRTYYRLLQTDFDGKTANLKTIMVNTSERRKIIEVIPNPSDGNFWFDLPSDVTDWSPSIINSGGQPMTFNYSSLGTRVSVDARNLPKGLYVFKLVSNRGIHAAKFVIE